MTRREEGEFRAKPTAHDNGSKTILGKSNESEVIREALALVAFREEVLRGYNRAAGKARDFGDIWRRR